MKLEPSEDRGDKFTESHKQAEAQMTAVFKNKRRTEGFYVSPQETGRTLASVRCEWTPYINNSEFASGLHSDRGNISKGKNFGVNLFKEGRLNFPCTPACNKKVDERSSESNSGETPKLRCLHDENNEDLCFNEKNNEILLQSQNPSQLEETDEDIDDFIKGGCGVNLFEEEFIYLDAENRLSEFNKQENEVLDFGGNSTFRKIENDLNPEVKSHIPSHNKFHTPSSSKKRYQQNGCLNKSSSIKEKAPFRFSLQARYCQEFSEQDVRLENLSCKSHDCSNCSSFSENKSENE